jgi:glutamate dehydrogenase (NAD(P)+)
MQGFGNVGAYAAEIYAEQGGKVIAVSDANGAVLNEAGLDIKALRRHLAETGDLTSFPEGAQTLESPWNPFSGPACSTSP